MTDKKLTDDEIVKALECLCGGGDSCSECAYHKRYRFGECRKQVAKNALDLITRQQAEIERLKNENMAKEAEYNDMLEQRNSVERYLETAKSEAVREFAEKSKKVWWDNGYESPDVDFDDFVDNLVKEMVGDNNA